MYNVLGLDLVDMNQQITNQQNTRDTETRTESDMT